MNTVQMSEVPLAYNIQVLAVSGSWTNGTGKFADTELSGGVTWAYRAGESDILWRTSSFTAGSTGSYNVYPGGGNWYTGSVVSQSFSFKQNNDSDSESESDTDSDSEEEVKQVQENKAPHSDNMHSFF